MPERERQKDSMNEREVRSPAASRKLIPWSQAYDSCSCASASVFWHLGAVKPGRRCCEFDLRAVADTIHFTPAHASLGMQESRPAFPLTPKSSCLGSTLQVVQH